MAKGNKRTPKRDPRRKVNRKNRKQKIRDAAGATPQPRYLKLSDVRDILEKEYAVPPEDKILRVGHIVADSILKENPIEDVVTFATKYVPETKEAATQAVEMILADVGRQTKGSSKPYLLRLFDSTFGSYFASFSSADKDQKIEEVEAEAGAPHDEDDPGSTLAGLKKKKKELENEIEANNQKNLILQAQLDGINIAIRKIKGKNPTGSTQHQQANE